MDDGVNHKTKRRKHYNEDGGDKYRDGDRHYRERRQHYDDDERMHYYDDEGRKYDDGERRKYDDDEKSHRRRHKVREVKQQQQQQQQQQVESVVGVTPAGEDAVIKARRERMEAWKRKKAEELSAKGGAGGGGGIGSGGSSPGTATTPSQAAFTTEGDKPKSKLSGAFGSVVFKSSGANALNAAAEVDMDDGEEDERSGYKLEKLEAITADESIGTGVGGGGGGGGDDADDVLDEDEETTMKRDQEYVREHGGRMNDAMEKDVDVLQVDHKAADDVDVDVDPLDAFMSDMSKKANHQDELDRQAMTEAAEAAAAGSNNLALPFDDDEVPDGEGEDDSEGEVALRAADIIALAQRKSKKKELVAVDHSKIKYEPFRKEFYMEPSEYVDMTDDQVDEMRLLMHGIKIRGKACPKPIQKWSQCGLNQQTTKVIRDLGYDSPTPIQCQAIPAIMSGRDVIGVAKTGSGKTVAFLLPMFRHIKDQRPLANQEGPISIVLTPTRELAAQIYRDCRPFLNALGLRGVCAYGGSPIKDQIAEFKRGAEIVVCTPGRMIDLLAANQGRVTNLRRVTYVVLDEADRMFDMGFEPQVMRIVGNTRPDRQTVLFSATFARQMEGLARKILKRPLEIVVGARSVVAPEIHQIVEVKSDDEKFVRLLDLLGQLYVNDDDIRTLIFVDRQEAADALLKSLMVKGYPTMSLHGGKDQFERDTTIQDFKSGVVRILTATSVAARGLDVKGLKLVVNYDCPNHMEDYVHRVGRTGRAGETGTAVTFITPAQGRYAVDIVKALKSSGAEINSDVAKLADGKFPQLSMRANERKEFLEQVRGGKEKASGIGFGGKGLDRFNRDRDMQRKLQRRAFGDEDEEDLPQRINSDDEGVIPPGSPSGAAVGDKPPVETMAANSVNDATSAIDKARQTINGNITARHRIARPGQEAGEIGDFHATVEINDFPQRARWAVTNRANIGKLLDQTGCSLTTKGNFYPPGKPVPVGEQKLYLLVEGETQKGVDKALRELRRLLTEATQAAMEGESRIATVGRYSVM